MAENSVAVPKEDIEGLVETIDKMGLRGPVAFALHVARPLAWIGGQLLWALDPFVGSGSGASFAGSGATSGGARRSLYLQSLATLLEREGGVDELLARLDRTSKGQD